MENPQGVEKHEANKSPIRPIVEYDPSLLKEDVPYAVNVDTEKCALLLHELGLSDERIQKLTIRLNRKASFPRKPFPTIAGTYRPKSDQVTIYTDYFWSRYQNFLKKGSEKPDKKIRAQIIEFLWTKMTGGHPEDVQRRKNSETVNRALAGTFLHEAKHAADTRGEKLRSIRFALRLASYGAIIGGTAAVDLAIYKFVPNVAKYPLIGLVSLLSYPLSYLTLDPYERRARTFDRDNRNDPRWQNLLTISPKQKQ